MAARLNKEELHMPKLWNALLVLVAVVLASCATVRPLPP
jgi:hypothetical protein